MVDNVMRVLFFLVPVYVITRIFYPVDPLQEVAIFVLAMVTLVYLRDAARPGRSLALRVTDLVGACLCLVIFGYPALAYDTIHALAGLPTPMMVNFGLVAIFLVLDATRRTLGWPLTIIVAAFVAYLFLGEMLPREFGGHGGYSLQRIATTIYLGTSGIYGVVTATLFQFVFLFVMFGKVLEAVGALRFIDNLARAVFGRFTGGPAMVAVTSSGMMGSVSGSAVANVMVTGSITIPLMRRLGFQPHVAGGVEAAASTGGQFMPPVMGAAAFLMAQMIGISYLAVISAALLPALLYFLGIMMSVYVYARRSGISGLPREDLPSIRSALADPAGLVFIIGITSLVTLLVMHFAPMVAALYAMIAMVVVHVLTPGQRRWKDMLFAAPRTTEDFLSISIAGPSVGIIVGTLLLTGLGSRFANIIFGLVGESLIPVLLLTMIASIILGVGLPTSVTYIILAIMVAPAIVALDVTPIAAHMFIFYMGLMAMVTPPVALAAYAAASIAETDFWRTGWKAFTFALPAFLLPYAFVLDNGLLMQGTTVDIAWPTATAALGVTALAQSLMGRATGTIDLVKRGAVFASALLLISPVAFMDLLGLALFVGVNARDGMRVLAGRRKRTAAGPAVAAESEGREGVGASPGDVGESATEDGVTALKRPDEQD